MKKVLIITLLLVSNICIFEPLKSEEIVKQQKIIIAKLEIKNQNLDSTIQILSEKIKELSTKQVTPKVANLIEL